MANTKKRLFEEKVLGEVYFFFYCCVIM